jgi:hypothetical protein
MGLEFLFFLFGFAQRAHAPWDDFEFRQHAFGVDNWALDCLVSCSAEQ